MKQLLLTAAIIVSLASCEKDRDTVTQPAHPEMSYRNLTNRVVNITTPAGVDISGDGSSDIWFEIFDTKDDANNRDIHRFLVSSGAQSKLLVNASGTPIINDGGTIATQVTNGYEWRSPAVADLATRTLVRNVMHPTWEGSWKDAQHKFIAVQVTQNGAVYNGWVELSFDMAAERVILYRSGISKEAGKDIVAGK